MKIIPYLRFAWATQLIVNSISGTFFLSATNQGPAVISFNFIKGLVGLTFILYCVIMAIQEIKNKQLIDAKFFYVFGIFFQILIFVGGFFILKVIHGIETIEVWRIALLVFWQ